MIAPLLDDAAPLHPRGWPMRMTICGAYEMRQGFVSWEVSHIISIQQAALPYRGADLSEEVHLLLDFDDVTDPSRLGAPTLAHLASAMSFVDSLPAEAVLVVHCAQGVSRSTALALGLLAREVPPARAAALLHGLRPFACPNPLLVRLWDDLLGFDGALIDAASPFPTLVWHDGQIPPPRTTRRKAS